MLRYFLAAILLCSVSVALPDCSNLSRVVPEIGLEGQTVETTPRARRLQRQLDLIARAQAQPTPIQTDFKNYEWLITTIPIIDRGRAGVQRGPYFGAHISFQGKRITLQSNSVHAADLKPASGTYAPENAAQIGPAGVRELLRQLSSRARTTGFDVLIVEGGRISGSLYGSMADVQNTNNLFRMVIDLTRVSPETEN